MTALLVVVAPAVLLALLGLSALLRAVERYEKVAVIVGQAPNRDQAPQPVTSVT
jgi:hypothetical protein